jgi:hypothetical protein
MNGGRMLRVEIGRGAARDAAHVRARRRQRTGNARRDSERVAASAERLRGDSHGHRRGGGGATRWECAGREGGKGERQWQHLRLTVRGRHRRRFTYSGQCIWGTSSPTLRCTAPRPVWHAPAVCRALAYKDRHTALRGPLSQRLFL